MPHKMALVLSRRDIFDNFVTESGPALDFSWNALYSCKTDNLENGKKAFHSSAFMKCPRCLRPVDHEAASCYSCGYSEVDAAAVFGRNRVLLNRVHDAAHCLRKQERDNLAETLDQLEVKFPQMLFCAYLGALPEHIGLSELGFWLLNHGQVKGAEYARPNENGILVVMDLNRKQIGISLGYFAETLISEEDGYRILTAARPNLVNAEYGEAIERIFLKLGKLLDRQGRKLKKLTREQIQATLGGATNPVLDLPPHLTRPRISPQQTPLEPEREEIRLSA